MIDSHLFMKNVRVKSFFNIFLLNIFAFHYYSHYVLFNKEKHLSSSHQFDIGQGENIFTVFSTFRKYSFEIEFLLGN